MSQQPQETNKRFECESGELLQQIPKNVQVTLELGNKWGEFRILRCVTEKA